MDGTTNLNNTGSGATPNWGNQQPATGQPQTGQPQTGSTAPGKGTATGPGIPATTKLNQDANTENVPGATQTVEVEDLQWTDIITNAAPVTDASVDINEPATPYVTYSDRPILPKSTVNDPDLANKALSLLQNPPPDKIQQMVEQFQLQLPPSGPSPELDEQYADVEVTDPEILALAQKTGMPPGYIQKNVQTEQNAQFSSLVGKFPKEVTEKLTFAHYAPEGAKDLSPELKAELASIEKQVKEGVANAFGFSEDWTGVQVDASDFLGTLGNEFDAAFDKLLAAKVADGSLSASDAATLKSMHNGLATGSPTLKNLLTTLQNQAIAQLQSKFGMDVGFLPTPDVAFYNNVVNGDFSQTFQKSVAKYTGKATEEQKALLEKFAKVIAANPKDPSIPESIREIVDEQQLLLQAFPDPDASSLPDNLKLIAKQLIAAATAATIEKYGLDDSWQPSIKVLVNPLADMERVNRTQNAMQVGYDALGNAKKIGEGMADGPEKSQFLAFLQVISKALGQLQDALYAMQGAQSNASRNASRGKLDMALNDLEQQKKAADKSEENVKKMVNMGPAGKALMWIVKIILLLISIWFGPMMMILMLAFFMDSVVTSAMGEKKTGFEMLMDKITEDLPPAAAAAIKIIITAFVALLNPWMAIYLFTTELHVIEDITKTCGGDKTAQSLAAMIVNMVIMIIIMALMTFITGGASSELIIAQIAQAVKQATEMAIETATQLVRVMSEIVKQLPSLMNIVTSSIQLNNDILLSFNDIIKGESEAYSEKLQAMIAVLQKLISKLIAMMQGVSQDIVSINEFQGKKWSQASQISSEIAG